MKTIVTHSGSFHSDDVFAVATLQLLCGTQEVNIIRSRDAAVISSGDIVVDVGGVYNPALKRFDHHQNGAPVRDNGVPYAAFGLVWREYGVEVAGSVEVADEIERILVLPIDAGDTGMSLYSLSHTAVAPYELYQVIGSFAPVWGSGGDKDEAFFEAVAFAKALLVRMIAQKTAEQNMKQLIADTYTAATDKRYLEFDVSVSAVACIEYPDVQFIISPDDPTSNQNWTATAVRKNYDSFESRVMFPESWAGLREAELQAVSGISDAVFCHKARFLFVAGSKEGVVQAVKMVG